MMKRTLSDLFFILVVAPVVAEWRIRAELRDWRGKLLRFFLAVCW